MDRIDDLAALLGERIVILDGAWGVLLQGRGLSEEDFRGDRFRDHPTDVKGDPDLLNLTRPDIVSELHAAYFDAGADIATTNTFTATSIGQADYGLSDAVYDMNVEGARLAREATDRHGRGWVAGSIGPLNVTLSMSPKVDEASFRTISFDQVYEAYAEQIRGLRDGGVDLLLIETIFDTLNAKAAIAAADGRRPRPPSMDLGDDHRPERTHTIGTDAGGVLGLDRARRANDRGRQLLARGDRDAALRRGARACGADPGELLPERRPPERVRRVRRDTRDHERLARGVRAGRAW